MTEPLKPPFAYYGAKVTIAERIVALLPPHEHYVEPFAGSLAVLLAKPPVKLETVNDLDRELVNFWHILREDRQRLEELCALTPHSRAEHEAAFSMAEVSDVERARRTWVRLTQGRAGTLRATGWKFYTDPRGTSSSMPRYLSGYVSRFGPVVARLARVSLECLPALEIIKAYGAEPRALLYVDPPYLGSTRALNYQHEMPSDAEHEALAEALAGAVAAVVVSGYRSPLYERLYDGWNRAEIAAFNGNGTDRTRTEVLWSNRPLAVPATLFDLEAS